ncbi:MAG TPA: YdcF family protein [Candidatus Caccocola faecigallinarum]|nr:YdcF family protein [Candidatus Caccocola faecigallinarum]
MFAIYKIAGAFAAPPGLFIIILLALAASSAVKARRHRTGHMKFTTIPPLLLAAAFYFMSIPAGAFFITGPLEAKYATKLPPDGETAAFIVLAGGSSYDSDGSSVQPSPLALERVYTAVTLASRREGESILVMSGGNVFGDKDRSEASAMRDAARAMGWRGEIILEEQSRTTAENMKYCAAILTSRNLRNAAVVTNAFHLPRAMRLAVQFMPDATLYPIAPTRLADPIIRGLPSFLPDAGSLYLSCLGARERIGTAAASISAAIR